LLHGINIIIYAISAIQLAITALEDFKLIVSNAL